MAAGWMRASIQSTNHRPLFPSFNLDDMKRQVTDRSIKKFWRKQYLKVTNHIICMIRCVAKAELLLTDGLDCRKCQLRIQCQCSVYIYISKKIFHSDLILNHFANFFLELNSDNFFLF